MSEELFNDMNQLGNEVLGYDPVRYRCLRCGKKINHHRNQQKWNRKFCSEECSKFKPRRRRSGPTISQGKSTCGTTGAIGELIVAADLMRRGYHVFRALSPQSPCDMIILKEGNPMRLEVTMGYKTKYGSTTFKGHDPEKFDVFALVMSDGTIEYRGLDEPKHAVAASGT